MRLLAEFETVLKLQGSQAQSETCAHFDVFETVLKLQGSQADNPTSCASDRFETVLKLQGSQASSITKKLSPNRYMWVML